MGDINFFVSVLFLLLLCFKYTSVIIAVSNNMIFYHEVKKLETFLFSLENNSELKQLRRRPQRRLQKKKGLMIKTTALHACITLLSTFLWCPLHAYEVKPPTHLMHYIWRTWTYDDELSFPFSNLNKILKNSYPGKFTCIWHIERVQIDTIMFERTKIHFLSTFSLPSSSSLLKVPNVISYYVKLK